jgi:ribulose-5-phosphate 4-epimerase/fuculose-1-phosphate aldolase
MTATNRRGASTRYSAGEWQARVDLAAAYRLVELHDMHDVIYTHISARVPDEDGAFLINPFGLWFHEITASSLVKVDIDGNVLDDSLGMGINYAGYVIHSAIHAERHDVDCVLHTHTKAGVALSCLKEGLLPLNQWALQFHGKIAYHDYEAIAFDLDERARLVGDLGDKPVMILRNHGLLTAGRSVAEAWKMMFNLERSCEAQLALNATAAELVYPPESVCEKTAGQYWEIYDAIDAGEKPDREWAAFLRLLDDKAPGYKD